MASMVLCGMPRRSRAMRLEAPKSMQKRMRGASTRMHVLNRPPDPNESPEPTNVTLTDMMDPNGCHACAPTRCSLPGLCGHQAGIEDDRERNGSKDYPIVK